jgi:hypothetical protein
MIDEAALRGIGAQALNIAKRDLQRGGFNFMVATYDISDDPPLHRLSDLEKELIERLGEDWLNDGRCKDAAFQVFRMAVDMLPPDAFVFVTPTNQFRPGPKWLEISDEEKRALLDSGHNRHHEAVAQGLLVRLDMLMAHVQTPELVGMYLHEWSTQLKCFVGQPEWLCDAQENFDGRLKMFGRPYR